MERRIPQAMAVAEPVLQAIGRQMEGREIVLVPGNHDAPLVRRWVRAHLAELRSDSAIPLNATPLLERVVELLRPARLRVRYPGFWAAERVWATHGHYVNHHLIPPAPTGLRRDWLGRPSSAVSVADYERRRRPQREDERPWPAPVEEALQWAQSHLLLSGPRAVLNPRVAPLTARLLTVQMQQAVIPSIRRVVRGLHLDPEWVVFGHVHRLGPLASDDLDAWAPAPGKPGVINAGSWLFEPLLASWAQPPHPYWPGGAVLLEDGHEPQAVGLLDGVDASALE